MNQISTEEGAGSGRVQIWKMTLKSHRENPILGTGPENLKEHFIQNGKRGFFGLPKKNR